MSSSEPPDMLSSSLRQPPLQSPKWSNDRASLNSLRDPEAAVEAIQREFKNASNSEEIAAAERSSFDPLSWESHLSPSPGPSASQPAAEGQTKTVSGGSHHVEEAEEAILKEGRGHAQPDALAGSSKSPTGQHWQEGQRRMEEKDLPSGRSI